MMGLSIVSHLRRLLKEPAPVRFLILRLVDRLNRFAHSAKLQQHNISRPHYRHCLYKAALLARKLGHSRMSAIEFGVAGGNGLLALERHAEDVTHRTGIQIDIYGFDTGTGLPPPVDYRDMPYLYQAGYFVMDPDQLKARLRLSKLILGVVEDTVPKFVTLESFPPIGFIAFDLDYYSSTMAAFKIFEVDEKRLLPRVACYFDDIVGDIDWAYNEFTGELLAVEEFNRTHRDMKIAPVKGLHFFAPSPELWHEQIFVTHIFKHADYGRPISELIDLPLASFL